ncbi:FAD-dependent oxidoreductase [Dasania sp. GY-MA-18]|uniref:FAD-dependent oxidoreductase n=1 Tax=Dasania phycosphaerae TaxID=2950436 RepID=A0A9J6RLL3_9GAMM|nr:MULTISPECIES: FAD-dependent oxidoreductase [Dasania]MCR8922457.1 FAD-dependent oxidoreductase [Dasania sp. GY-MA-18]MCZ0864885.1 FAD-dependent oxidoreductase [Dasania phycosphaerae]MCZ0868613.1 FAD-dependent oxidoreductase [Dasania phycosphaerae]
MSQHSIEVDIAIIGGGIAGLWLLNRLCQQGYNAILFEQGDLGGAQTIASQGMIHGGIKYALSGALSGSSEAIADMPDHWRRCLKGEGDVDLRKAKVLSEHFYLWSTASIASKFTSFFASKLTRGRVDKVSRNDYPAAFANPKFKGRVYRLVDLVLDVPSLLSTLANNCAGRIFAINNEHCQWHSNGQNIESLSLQQGEQHYHIKAQRFIFSAGKGNGDLMQQLNIQQPAMQLRPLQQVLVKHSHHLPLYAHCMGNNPSPRLTISSHQTEDGNTVWYLGGDLATEHANSDSAVVIAKAKQELAELFPWLDFSAAQWATLRIDRAEPKQKGLIKPDQAFAAKAGNLANAIIAWPTKLTLSPNLGDQVDALLRADNIAPQHSELHPALKQLATPQVARPCWETLFNQAPL